MNIPGIPTNSASNRSYSTSVEDKSLFRAVSGVSPTRPIENDSSPLRDGFIYQGELLRETARPTDNRSQFSPQLDPQNVAAINQYQLTLDADITQQQRQGRILDLAV